jgi:hypothetical protein
MLPEMNAWHRRHGVPATITINGRGAKGDSLPVRRPKTICRVGDQADAKCAVAIARVP